MDYLYDGSFEGLLTCIHHHYYTEKADGIFVRDEYQPSLLNGYMEVRTDEEKANTVYDAIEKKISAYDLKRLYRAFLSCETDKEMKILRYATLGFKIGSAISMLHANQVVMEVQAIEKKIFVETERMLQFVRFSVLDGDILYARIEPDNDVVELTADHFCDRYRNEPFIIHDVRRGKALIAFNGEWYISEFDDSSVPKLSSSEKEYRSLWKKYFDSMAIKERINPNLQRKFMPLRYQKNMTEINTL